MFVKKAAVYCKFCFQNSSSIFTFRCPSVRPSVDKCDIPPYLDYMTFQTAQTIQTIYFLKADDFISTNFLEFPQNFRRECDITTAPQPSPEVAPSQIAFLSRFLSIFAIYALFPQFLLAKIAISATQAPLLVWSSPPIEYDCTLNADILKF